jgi:hypothetical protein
MISALAAFCHKGLHNNLDDHVLSLSAKGGR